MTRSHLSALQGAVSLAIKREGLRPLSARIGVPVGVLRGAKVRQNLTADSIAELAAALGLEFYIGPPRDPRNARDLDALMADRRLLRDRIDALQSIDGDIAVILDRLRARLAALAPDPPGAEKE